MKQNASSQMLKGILQGVMLLILEQHSDYGYGLSKQLSHYGLQDMPKGTIYPLLTTMEKKGLIKGKMRPSDDGPDRKYYEVTSLGKQAKQDFLVDWDDLSTVVNRIIDGGMDDENKRNDRAK